ncbi:MAG: hypothetical protein V1936_01545 [Patescibacteria group bacterium]
MQKLLTAFLAAIFLAACAPTSVEPSKKTATENQTTDNFERSLECQKRKDNAREQISKITKDTTGTLVFELEDIFYSPKRNSCLYIYGGCTEGMWCAKYLVDLFANGEKLAAFSMSDSESADERVSNSNKFQEKVKEYQN